MRLLRLRLLNFRQHASTDIEFRTGLTGIIGPNGAGKSTILEAIAWAIYGSSAARGTNDTIRFSRAQGRARVEVELAVALAGHELRIVRSLTSAEVYLDGGQSPVASGIGTVTRYVQERLGMSREEFFNTYFTGQKELQFLAQMGPAQRGRFLGQVLGYERLRRAQDLARVRRNELRHEMEGVRSSMPDPEAVAAERSAAEARREAAVAELARAEEAGRAALAERAELVPEWERAQAARDGAREARHALDVASTGLAAARRDLERTRGELEAVARAEAELAPLRERLAELPALAEECERLARLAREAERRRALEEQGKTLEAERAEIAARRASLERAPALLEQCRAEAVDVRAELAEAEAGAARLRDEWIERRREAETRLDTYRGRAQDLKTQLQQLREAGPEGTCPTCERPLGREFDNVIGRLQDEWETLVQDGKWLSQRVAQLQDPPPELAAAEKERVRLAKALEEKSQRVTRCERAVQDRDAAEREHARREEQLARLRQELAGLSADYDAARHTAADARLAELRSAERDAARLEQAATARAAREAERADAESRARTEEAAIAGLEARLASSPFDEEAFSALRAAYDVAGDAVRRAELHRTECSGAAKAAAEALEAALRAEAALHERQAALQALRIEQRHHSELDDALTELRGELNGRVRPELGELASGFLTEITDGRYTNLEIDDNYNVLVLDEGEEKPVISGGEEDVANLVLRLAISQMIAERAGHPLSILVLDEVFGSLDVERRDNVIQLLHRLGNRFDQVILITHIETIREGLDHIIRVDFDERAGASRVVEENAPEPEAEFA